VDLFCPVKFGFARFIQLFRLAWQKFVSDWRGDIALSLE